MVEAFDEDVVGFIDVGVQARPYIEEASGDFAFVGDLFFGQQVGRFSALGVHGQRLAESRDPATQPGRVIDITRDCVAIHFHISPGRAIFPSRA